MFEGRSWKEDVQINSWEISIAGLLKKLEINYNIYFLIQEYLGNVIITYDISQFFYTFV
jgi:hypothetical protein